MPAPETPPRTFGDVAPSSYPGERLGLPERGRRSVGRVGRRLAALAIDWAAAMLVATLFTPYDSVAYTWMPSLVFLVMQVVAIPIIGGSIGHRIVGLQLQAISGGWIGLWRPVVRSLLLVIVIPALVWDSDQRGFHDKIAGTILLRA